LALAKACALGEVVASFAVSVLYEVIRRYDQRLNDEKAFGIEEMAYSRLMKWLSNRVPAREPRRYPALGDVWKGGKNGIPIHGRASYRRACVVRRLLYPFNETQHVTMINRPAASHPRQASLASLKIAIDPINARRNDMVIGFVVATALPTRPVVWCRSYGFGQVARTQKLPS
jgi:hypothetical protein